MRSGVLALFGFLAAAGVLVALVYLSVTTPAPKSGTNTASRR
jgi:hypothetical protein